MPSDAFPPDYSRRSVHAERMGLSTLEDISHLILQSHGLDETLQNIVTLVANRMRTEVCSIYLCEDEQLTLRASVGLAESAVGNTHLAFGEGLVGYTAKTCTMVNVNEPQQDERFCYVVGSTEENYHSFLGIPLFDRQNLIGVMAIQTIQPRKFTDTETSTLSTIAFQLSTVVASTRLLDRLELEATRADQKASEEQQQSKQTVSMIKGDFGFGTAAIGPAHLIDDSFVASESSDVDPKNPTEELEKVNSAFAAARIETLCLEKKIAERLDERDAAIFHSHLTILQDRVFLEKVSDLVRDGFGAAASVKQVVAGYKRIFSRLQDPYLRGRGADVEDVGRRILSHLLGDDSAKLSLNLPGPGIVIAKELMASDIAVMDLDQVQGIVLQRGDANSHAAIIAKSLGIPTLVGASGVLDIVDSGAMLVLDAQTKTLHIEPSPELRDAYLRLLDEGKAKSAELQRFVEAPAVTSDGTQVTLRSNIGLRSDVDVARRSGGSGVGLYRTELPYMARTSFPDRQTQYEIYRHVVEGFPGESVTIRTLDIGGDKSLSYFKLAAEENPFLGYRSVRVSLDQRDMFQTQIEAILLAAMHGDVRIMFPMVTNLDEIVACKEVLAAAKASLQSEGFQISDIPVGMMIETPASVTMAESFASEVDFFSLGTNDLVQYLLAADRGNARIGHYYQSLHPAVLRAIASVVAISEKHRKGLSICGEMVSDPAAFAVLVGLGIREFSASSPAILPLKAMLVQQSILDLRKLADAALQCQTTADIQELAKRQVG